MHGSPEVMGISENGRNQFGNSRASLPQGRYGANVDSSEDQNIRQMNATDNPAAAKKV